jgi:uncharacterized protein with FMN-binding domain
MRKSILGIGVTAIFLAYSIVLRHQHSEPVLAPAQVSQNKLTNPALPATTTPTTTTAVTPTPSSQYKDGTYTGSIANAYYGNVQVQAVINAGKITSVNFIQSPNDNPNSIYINQQAMPYLKQEAVRAQSSKVSTITGATLTSQAFTQSLANALRQALQS